MGKFRLFNNRKYTRCYKEKDKKDKFILSHICFLPIQNPNSFFAIIFNNLLRLAGKADTKSFIPVNNYYLLYKYLYNKKWRAT